MRCNYCEHHLHESQTHVEVWCINHQCKEYGIVKLLASDYIGLPLTWRQHNAALHANGQSATDQSGASVNVRK